MEVITIVDSRDDDDDDDGTTALNVARNAELRSAVINTRSSDETNNDDGSSSTTSSTSDDSIWIKGLSMTANKRYDAAKNDDDVAYVGLFKDRCLITPTASSTTQLAYYYHDRSPKMPWSNNDY